MECVRCGYENKKRARYCRNCGITFTREMRGRAKEPKQALLPPHEQDAPGSERTSRPKQPPVGEDEPASVPLFDSGDGSSPPSRVAEDPLTIPLFDDKPAPPTAVSPPDPGPARPRARRAPAVEITRPQPVYARPEPEEVAFDFSYRDPDAGSPEELPAGPPEDAPLQRAVRAEAKPEPVPIPVQIPIDFSSRQEPVGEEAPVPQEPRPVQIPIDFASRQARQQQEADPSDEPRTIPVDFTAPQMEADLWEAESPVEPEPIPVDFTAGKRKRRRGRKDQEEDGTVRDRMDLSVHAPGEVETPEEKLPQSILQWILYGTLFVALAVTTVATRYVNFEYRLIFSAMGGAVVSMTTLLVQVVVKKERRVTIIWLGIYMLLLALGIAMQFLFPNLAPAFLQ